MPDPLPPHLPFPPFMCAARTQICVHVKDPISICRQRVGLTAGGMVTQKQCVAECTLSFILDLYKIIPCIFVVARHL